MKIFGHVAALTLGRYFPLAKWKRKNSHNAFKRKQNSSQQQPQKTQTTFYSIITFLTFIEMNDHLRHHLYFGTLRATSYVVGRTECVCGWLNGAWLRKSAECMKMNSPYVQIFHKSIFVRKCSTSSIRLDESFCVQCAHGWSEGKVNFRLWMMVIFGTGSESDTQFLPFGRSAEWIICRRSIAYAER